MESFSDELKALNERAMSVHSRKLFTGGLRVPACMRVCRAFPRHPWEVVSHIRYVIIITIIRLKLFNDIQLIYSYWENNKVRVYFNQIWLQFNLLLTSNSIISSELENCCWRFFFFLYTPLKQRHPPINKQNMTGSRCCGVLIANIFCIVYSFNVLWI